MAKKRTPRKSGNALRKTLTPKQHVRVRSVKTGKLATFRSNRNFIFEVWEWKEKPVRFKSGPRKGRVNKSKPPKREQVVVRYLNKVDKKSKRPIGRSYTAVQFRFLTAKVVKNPRKLSPLAQSQQSVVIQLNNRNLIVDQLLMKKAEPLKKLIRKYKEKLVQVYSRIRTDRGDDLAGPAVVVAPSSPWQDTARIIAMNTVYGPMKDASIRMSPKKYQVRKTNQMEKIYVTFTVAKV